MHVVIEIFPWWNGFSSHVTGPKRSDPHSRAHKSSAGAPNETQMWNVSAQLDLRQLGLRGRLFPESHNIHETISITPLRPESAKRCRSDWKENASTHLSVYFKKSAPTRGETTRWKNEDVQREVSEKGSPDEDILKVALQPIKIAAGFRDLQVVGA